MDLEVLGLDGKRQRSLKAMPLASWTWRCMARALSAYVSTDGQLLARVEVLIWQGRRPQQLARLVQLALP